MFRYPIKAGVLTIVLAQSLSSLYGQGCGMLCNTDFEDNPVTGIYPTNVHDTLVSCWSTTAPDSLFEIWPAANYENVPAYSGSNFIELNANYASTLYQTFAVNPGTHIHISFAHRGRLGVDEMTVQFGDAGGPYVNLGNFSTGTTWTLYTINYTVPATANGTQELRFSAVSTSTGNQTVGNFLDAIDVAYVITGIVNNATNITCNGGTNGSIDVTAVGGFPPITYDMGATPQSNGTFAGLQAGLQVVTMTDSNGCQYTVDTVLSEPPAILVDTITLTPATCGHTDGVLEVIADSGVAPYQYSIDGGNTWQSNGLFTGLDSGSYSIQVIDNNLCENSAYFYVPDLVSTVVTINTQSDITCKDANDGSIDVSANGGLAPYVYDIGSGGQQTGIFDNLPPGNYTVTITDDNGCVIDTNIILNEPGDSLTATVSYADETCYGDCSGQIQINAFGGTTPYSYSIDPGATYSTSTLFDSLCSGTYFPTIKDSNGCLYSDTILIAGPPPVIADFNASPLSGTGPLYVDFYNNSTGAINYMWNFMDGNASVIPDPSHTFGTGEFNVMLIAVNGPCSDTAYRVISVVSESILRVPNIITVNGDGSNDAFGMLYHQNIVRFQCRIFNRWGQTIYMFDDVNRSWDGKNRDGDYVSDGTYFYLIDALGGDGKVYQLKGTFTAIVNL